MADIWHTIANAPEGQTVLTKIDDEHGARNEQPLVMIRTNPAARPLWFFPDRSMYVYYTPTHWRPCAATASHSRADTGASHGSG